MGTGLDVHALALILSTGLPALTFWGSVGMVLGLVVRLVRNVATCRRVRTSRKRAIAAGDVSGWQRFFYVEGVPASDLGASVDAFAELRQNVLAVNERVFLGFAVGDLAALLACAVLVAAILVVTPVDPLAATMPPLTVGVLFFILTGFPLTIVFERVYSMRARRRAVGRLELERGGASAEGDAAAPVPARATLTDYRHPVIGLLPPLLIGLVALATIATVRVALLPFAQSTSVDGSFAALALLLFTLPLLTLVAYAVLEGLSLRWLRLPHRVFTWQSLFSRLYEEYQRRATLGEIYASEVTLCLYLIVLQVTLLALVIVQMPLQAWLGAILLASIVAEFATMPLSRRVIRRRGRLGGSVSGWRAQPPVNMRTVPSTTQ